MRSRRQGAHAGLVLCYHRVAVVDVDPWSLAVSPARFAEQLQVLRHRFAPVALAGILPAAADRRRRAVPVAVTFDDGYADVLHEALPLLQRFEVPATAFIVSGALDSARGFWWDELAALVLRAPTPGRVLTATIGGTLRRWDVEPAGHGSAVRERLYRSLHAELRPLEAAARARVLDELWSCAGRPCPVSAEPSLSRDELVRLAAGAQIEIGAHTVSHPVLAGLPAVSQLREAIESRSALEELLGKPVASFAYPYGGSDDLTEMTAALVAEAGFRRACTTRAAPLDRRADPFRLPRLAVGDWDGDRFERELVLLLGDCRPASRRLVLRRACTT